MFEVLAKRSDQEGVIYVDFAKKKIMQGIIVNVPTMEAVAAHAKEPPQLQKMKMLDHTQLPLQHALVMGTPNAAKKLVVFTDPDCPYCRVLHAELIKLEKSGLDVAIYILLYPLPAHPQAYDKSRMIIVSKDKTLLNNAFEGKDIPKPKGDEGKTEIEAVAKFAHSYGINGTPTMVLPNGAIITGVRDFESLKKLLADQ
jgi:thiol:disulfide interchange protein DsbC